MLQKISLFAAAFAFMSVAVFGVMQPAYAAYNPVPTDACSGAAATNPACAAPGADPVTGKNGVIIRVANVIAFAAGVIAVVMIIFAGFQLIKSGGDSGKITRARETIIYTLVGIVVIVLARFIIALVISKL